MSYEEIIKMHTSKNIKITHYEPDTTPHISIH